MLDHDYKFKIRKLFNVYTHWSKVWKKNIKKKSLHNNFKYNLEITHEEISKRESEI